MTHLAVILALALACCGLAHAQGGPRTLLAPGPWPEGLAGWEQRGPADFGLDAEVTREGRATARVRVAVGAKLEYQQLAWVARDDIRENDEFRVTAWVRTEGVQPGDGGAYVAFEVLDADGKRVAVFHNKLGWANGRDGWEELWVEGRAPEGAVALRLCLVMHAEGTAWWSDPAIIRTARPDPWPELGTTTREVTIHADRVVQPRFRGVGFHAFHHIFDYTEEQLNEVVLKRWRELNPSFARLNDQMGWDRARWDSIARHVQFMKATGTEVYIATWDPEVTEPGEARRAHARRVADNLEYLIREKGCDNIRWYCMSNELTLKSWGAMAQDLPTFRDYQQCLHDEFRARGLEVGLLASDAAPASYWWTLQWVAKNMDAITEIYGGHHYFAEHNPDDGRFYPWFRGKLQEATDLARAQGKDFILGEFGSKQDGSVVDGVKRDVCIWWDTPQEPYVTLQLADAVIAAINTGVYAMGYWTFMDVPDDYVKGYINKWGTFKWSGDDFSTRDHYYGYGLLSKFFRGPARALAVEVGDPRLRVAAIQQHNGGGAWSIAVVNRNDREVALSLRLAGGAVTKPFRKYVYEAARVVHSPFGDLPGPVGTLSLSRGALADKVPPNSLTVYTTAYDATPPAPVLGVAATRQADGSVRVSWEAGGAQDLCYYRVYRAEAMLGGTDYRTQIGSTVATQLVDHAPPDGEPVYAVVAVDQSGNAGKPATPR